VITVGILDVLIALINKIAALVYLSNNSTMADAMQIVVKVISTTIHPINANHVILQTVNIVTPKVNVTIVSRISLWSIIKVNRFVRHVQKIAIIVMERTIQTFIATNVRMDLK